MQIHEDTEQVQNKTIPGSWGDLLLYLLGGLGLFVISGSILGYYFRDIDLNLTILAILNNIIFIGGSVYVFGILRNRLSWTEMGIYPPVWRWEYLPWAAALALGIIPLRAGCGLVTQYLLEGSLDSVQARSDLIFSGGLTFGSFILILVSVGVLAPIAEELYFRGLIYDWLRQHFGVAVGITISAIMFGLAHFDSIGVMVSSMIIGVVMAYMYERTKSLWVAIAIHVITNSSAVILAYGAMLVAKVYDFPMP